MAENTDFQVDSQELKKFRDQLLQTFLRGQSSFEQALGLSEENILGMALYARQLAEEGQLEDARELLASLAQFEPQLGYVYTCLGAVEMQLDDADAAIQALHRALELTPDDIAANTHLGELYLEQGKFDRSAEYFRAAVDLDPEGSDPFANRARALASIVVAVAKEVDERGSDALDEMRGRIAQLQASEVAN